MNRNNGRFFYRTVTIGRLIPLFAALMVGPLFAAEENNVHLYGTLVAEPCVIPPGEEEIELDFGTVIDKSLYLNKRTSGQPFSIHLTECDLSLGNTVKVTFSGKENPNLPGLLALDGGSSASGVGIGLETQEGKALPLKSASEEFQLSEGSYMINLKAYVQGEPEAIQKKSIGLGTLSAVATFSLEYE